MNPALSMNRKYLGRKGGVNKPTIDPYNAISKR